MNIIFLDVDGVLNSTKKLIKISNLTGKPYSEINYPFDENCMNNLKYLVEKTDSYIIISSSWRKQNDMRNRLLEELRKYDLENRIIGYTKALGNKADEIREYILSSCHNINFIVLDDDKKLENMIDNLIITDSYYGLSKENVDTAIRLLRKK
ncbi:MAG: HAD domain-containing protein [Bacilli bacterium]